MNFIAITLESLAALAFLSWVGFVIYGACFSDDIPDDPRDQGGMFPPQDRR